MSHAKRGPSKAKRILLCAASAEREAVLPDDDQSAPANEGSNAHWLLEQGIAEGNWPPAMVAFGPDKLQAALPYPAFELPEDLVEQAKLCYEYAQRRAKEMGAEIQAESKVNPELYTARDDNSGTVDVSLVAATEIEIVDLKTGGMQVEADDPQLKLYALGVMAKYADPLSCLTPFQKIRLTVFQPKRPGMDTVERSVDFTQDQLIDWVVEEWVPACTASDSPNAKASPSAEGCKYCKAQKYGVCPEYTAHVQQAASQLFAPVDGQAVEVVDPLESGFSVENMSPEQIGYFLEVWPLMKARAKDIEEKAIALMKARTTIPNMKLVRGRGSRGWALAEEEQDKKFKNMKLTQAQRYKTSLKSPAQLLGDTSLSVKQKGSIKKHIVHKDGALTIAHISDPRVDVAPEVTFEPVAVLEAPPVDLSFLQL